MVFLFYIDFFETTDYLYIKNNKEIKIKKIMLRVTNGILIAAKIMGIGTFSWWWIIGITLVGVICKALSDKVDIYIETNN